MTLKLKLQLFFLLITITTYCQNIDSNTVGINKNDMIKVKNLNILLKLHEQQKPKDENYTKLVAKNFNLSYAKSAYNLSIELSKLDTVQALTIDIGYILELREEYDSAFAYYYNTISLFEQLQKFDKTFSLTQNILYNNTDLYKIIEEDKLKQSAQNRNINILFTLITIFFVITILLIALFYKKLKSKNNLISINNDRLEYYKNQVEASLDYAQKIQSSIILNESDIIKKFPDSFVFYKPKDKVSGDFLWTNNCVDDIFIAIADCTGHGVPGALLTVVGSFLLDAIVNFNEIKQTNKILDKLHLDIVKTLNRQPDNKTNDGMDIALFRINKKLNTLQFSGANRTLYILRNNEMIQLNGDRRPIGETLVKYADFNSTDFKLQKDDIIYTFTDGYYDQLGGLSGKKFYKKNLIKLLAVTSNQKLNQQKIELQDVFEKHKHKEVQTDDVLVVGLKIL